jgi:antitoxin HicB
MKNNMTKDLTYYESLPYTVIMRKDEDGDFVARIQELPGCIAHGEDEASAIEQLYSMQKLWLEDALRAGDAIPEPEDEAALPSGKWVQRVPRKLHRDLVRMAERESVSLNQLVTSMLTEAHTVRSCTHAIEATLLANMHVLNHARGAFDYLWWGSGERSDEATDWAITSQVATGNLMKRIARVKNLGSCTVTKSATLGDFFLSGETIDRHMEGYKQLARK